MSTNTNYSFLTTNFQKAKDFKVFGFGVEKFEKEIKEIKSPHTDIISIYKAEETGLNNIIVEDTGLFVEGASFCGSEIKYVYEYIKDDPIYNRCNAKWVVSICLKTEDDFFVARGISEGVLSYPATEHGYNFETIFAINVNGKEKHFSDLTHDERLEYGPRYKALRMLTEALENNDYSKLLKISRNHLPEWKGEYQEDDLPKKSVIRRNVG